jgi:four helix bundle protein
MHRFKQLEMWKKSRTFCAQIYAATTTFPEGEKFGLVNQSRRACVSIPSNIAEGSSRKSNKDFSRFIEIAMGSAYEIETQLLISYDLNFISYHVLEDLTRNLNVITKMMSTFKSNLKL